MKTENEKQNKLFSAIFWCSFKVIFTDFLLKKIEKFNFLSGKPYFFKINKYSFAM